MWIIISYVVSWTLAFTATERIFPAGDYFVVFPILSGTFWEYLENCGFYWFMGFEILLMAFHVVV